jgi:hypothetical protein
MLCVGVDSWVQMLLLRLTHSHGFSLVANTSNAQKKWVLYLIARVLFMFLFWTWDHAFKSRVQKLSSRGRPGVMTSSSHSGARASVPSLSQWET